MGKNRKTITSGILLTFVLSAACRNLSHCDAIKNGTFYYHAKRTKERINIQRNDSIQIETDSKTGRLISKSKVIWKTGCPFDLFLNAFSDEKLTGDDSIIATTPANVDIIETGDSFYVCTAKLTVFGKTIQLRDTMYFNKIPD